MVNQKELRRGNLILGVYQNEESDEELTSVCEYLTSDLEGSYLYVNSKKGIEEFVRFEPIPLSEEILLKAKYKLVNPNTRCYQKPKSQTLYFSETGVRMSTGIPMKYLHELQNRVKSIEGKELEIEL